MRGGAPRSSLAGGFSDLAQPRRGVLSGGKRGAGVDVLAVPAYGPWAAMKETIDFARAVGASHGFPIHDGLLHERGVRLIYGRLQSMTGMEMHDLRDAGAWTPA